MDKTQSALDASLREPGRPTSEPVLDLQRSNNADNPMISQNSPERMPDPQWIDIADNPTLRPEAVVDSYSQDVEAQFDEVDGEDTITSVHRLYVNRRPL